MNVCSTVYLVNCGRKPNHRFNHKAAPISQFLSPTVQHEHGYRELDAGVGESGDEEIFGDVDREHADGEGAVDVREKLVLYLGLFSLDGAEEGRVDCGLVQRALQGAPLYRYGAGLALGRRQDTSLHPLLAAEVR